MDINAANLAALNTTYSTAFNAAREGAMPLWPKVAMRTQSLNAATVYRWLGMLSGMQELVDEVNVGNVSNNGMTLTNKTYYDAVSVSANDIKDDAYGTYTPLMAALGDSAANHPDILIGDLLNNSFTALDYTGAAFFATSKAHIPGVTKARGASSTMTFGNKGTAALADTSIAAGIAALREIRNPQGIALNRRLDLALVVPAELEYTAKKLVEAATVSTGGANVQANLAEVVVLPELTSATAWFLLNRASPVKPLLFQEREAPVLTSLTNPTDENVFFRDEFVWKVQGRWTAGYGLPQFAYGSTGAS